jgi:phytoene dehydrogenase-like protein
MLNALYRTAEKLGIDILYDAPVTALEVDNGMFLSATAALAGRTHQVRARRLAAVLPKPNSPLVSRARAHAHAQGGSASERLA